MPSGPAFSRYSLKGICSRTPMNSNGPALWKATASPIRPCANAVKLRTRPQPGQLESKSSLCGQVVGISMPRNDTRSLPGAAGVRINAAQRMKMAIKSWYRWCEKNRASEDALRKLSYTKNQ